MGLNEVFDLPGQPVSLSMAVHTALGLMFLGSQFVVLE